MNKTLMTVFDERIVDLRIRQANGGFTFLLRDAAAILGDLNIRVGGRSLKGANSLSLFDLIEMFSLFAWLNSGAGDIGHGRGYKELILEGIVQGSWGTKIVNGSVVFVERDADLPFSEIISSFLLPDSFRSLSEIVSKYLSNGYEPALRHALAQFVSKDVSSDLNKWKLLFEALAVLKEIRKEQDKKKEGRQ